MTTKQTYLALIANLRAVEEETGLYLADECVDRENVDLAEDHPDYWTRLCAAAWCAAEGRADEYGKNLNALLGRIPGSHQ